jgi:hypothetical protein
MGELFNTNSTQVPKQKYRERRLLDTLKGGSKHYLRGGLINDRIGGLRSTFEPIVKLDP